jgi:hypothetical protein
MKIETYTLDPYTYRVENMPHKGSYLYESSDVEDALSLIKEIFTQIHANFEKLPREGYYIKNLLKPTPLKVVPNTYIHNYIIYDGWDLNRRASENTIQLFTPSYLVPPVSREKFIQVVVENNKPLLK